MAKLDICNPGWIEVVFAGRNQAYGAYMLRRENSKTMARALLLGCFLFIMIFSASGVYNHLSGIEPVSAEKERIIVLELTPAPLIDKKIVAPLPVETSKPQIKLTSPIVVSADEVLTEEPLAIADLKLIDLGNAHEGAPVEEFSVEVAEVTKASNTVEDKIIGKEELQILPQFPGGAQGWAAFMRGYNYPPLARDHNVSGVLLVSFVVEKDGSLTNIRVIRDIGFGTGEEAVRLLKTSKKWEPGIQNGLKVRVAYTQPIKLALQ